MKKAILLPIVLIFTLTYFICGCKKSSTGSATDSPTITVTSPTEGTTYTGSISMSFSVASSSGLDSCYLSLINPATSSAIYYNSFNTGADVRNKTSFSFSVTQTTLPTALTDMQCIIKAVNLNKTSVVKIVNVKVKQ